MTWGKWRENYDYLVDLWLDTTMAVIMAAFYCNVLDYMISRGQSGARKY